MKTVTSPRPLLIGQFGVFPGRHVEIRRGFELCAVLSFLRKSLDSLPGLLSLFPLVANFPSPRSNSRLKVKAPRVNPWPWPSQTAGFGTGLSEKQFWSWGPGVPPLP